MHYHHNYCYKESKTAIFEITPYYRVAITMKDGSYQVTHYKCSYHSYCHGSSCGLRVAEDQKTLSRDEIACLDIFVDTGVVTDAVEEVAHRLLDGVHFHCVGCDHC